MPALFTAVSTFWLCVRAPVTMWTFASSRPALSPLLRGQHAPGGRDFSKNDSLTPIPPFFPPRQHVLVMRPRAGDDVDVRFEPPRRHPERIVNAILTIDDKFARDDVKQLQ